MNDIIKLILFNMILFGILKYDKRYSIPIIVFMILYIITIKSSIRTKIVEGNSFFDNFIEMPEFTKYDYSTTMPNSILHNSEDQGYSSVFSFFNGGGKYSTLKNDRMSVLEEINELLDKLINMFEMGQQNCMGEFEKFSECSRECGYGTQEQVYRIIQEKGPNGNDCPYTEGHTIKKPGMLKGCDEGLKCRFSQECRSGYCDNGTCRRIGECDKDTLYHCYTEDECVGLNGKYNTDSRNRYEWDSRTNTCSFEFTPQTEYRYFDRPGLPESGGGSGEEPGCSEDNDCDEGFICRNNRCIKDLEEPDLPPIICDNDEDCEPDQYCDDNNECKNTTYRDYFWTDIGKACNDMCEKQTLKCDYDGLKIIKGHNEVNSYKKLYNNDIASEWKGGPGGSGCNSKNFDGNPGNVAVTVETRQGVPIRACSAPPDDVESTEEELCDYIHPSRAAACKCTDL